MARLTFILFFDYGVQMVANAGTCFAKTFIDSEDMTQLVLGRAPLTKPISQC